MVIKYFIPVLATLILSAPPTRAADSMDLPVVDVEEMDGGRVAVYVEEHALSTYPAWEPGRGDVPVSIAEALAAVEAWVKKYNPHYGKVVFNEVILKQVRSHDRKLYWHYLVRYRETLEDGAVSPKESIAAVFLNGGVVPVMALPKP